MASHHTTTPTMWHSRQTASHYLSVEIIAYHWLSTLRTICKIRMIGRIRSKWVVIRGSSQCDHSLIQYNRRQWCAGMAVAQLPGRGGGVVGADTTDVKVHVLSSWCPGAHRPLTWVVSAPTTPPPQADSWEPCGTMAAAFTLGLKGHFFDG